MWSGVAQYCLLVGNYNSATAILESLESPPIARLKVTVSSLRWDEKYIYILSSFNSEYSPISPRKLFLIIKKLII